MTFETYYDKHWLPLGSYLSHHRKRFLQTWASLSDHLTKHAGTVLDVGGVGPIGAYLATLGWTTLESKVDLRGPLPFMADLFDLVLCTETIEHIKDIESSAISDLEACNYSGVRNMLRELHRVLRPNGYLLITTPNASSLHTLSKWLHGEVLLMDPGHVREFTPLELRRIVEGCGFEQHDSRIVDSWSPGSLISEASLRSMLRLHRNFAAVSRQDNIISIYRLDPSLTKNDA